MPEPAMWEILAGVGGGLCMAACCMLGLRVWQARRNARRAAAQGLDADERRFKRRLERQIQEVDDIFGDDLEEGSPGDVELDAREQEQLRLVEAEVARGKSGACKQGGQKKQCGQSCV